MIIEDIASRLMDMNHEYCMKHYDYLKNPPKFVIYIGMETYSKMMGEIYGQVSSYVMEFYREKAIFGFPVYRTTDHEHWKIYREE